MDKRMHFIWGNSSHSENRIRLLKMNGMDQIFVLDKNQKIMIRERDDVAYVSSEYLPLFKIDQPGKVHHFFMKLPPSETKKRS